MCACACVCVCVDHRYKETFFISMVWMCVCAYVCVRMAVKADSLVSVARCADNLCIARMQISKALQSKIRRTKIVIRILCDQLSCLEMYIE